MALTRDCLRQDADCCGETLIRILLGVPSLQAEVARVILEIIPQQCGENADPEHPMQKRLLGQLRWWGPRPFSHS